MSHIHLDGGETSVIRALGFGGSAISGRDLKGRVPTLGDAALFSTLQTLIAVGYIDAHPEISQAEEIETASFQVNPGYARELKEALDPKEPPTRSRRVRRE